MAKRWSVFFGLVLVAVLAGSSSAAPTPAPTASADSNVQTRCSIEIDRKEGWVVGDAVPYRLGGCPAGLEISQAATLFEHGIAARPGRVLVIVKDGDLSIPELDVIDTKSLAVVAKTDPITLKAQTAITGQGEEAMKPAPPIGYVILGLPTWIQMAIALVVLALAMLIAYFIFRWIKNKAKRLIQAVMPKKPYEVQALERLQKLLDAGHLKKSEWKVFAFGVSETMKFYLGHRYGFDAQESTTSELFSRLDELRGSAIQGLNLNTVQILKTAFDDLDLVKFTDHKPSVDSMLIVWKNCKQVIETTRPQKVEPILPENLSAKKTSGVQP